MLAGRAIPAQHGDGTRSGRRKILAEGLSQKIRPECEAVHIARIAKRPDSELMSNHIASAHDPGTEGDMGYYTWRLKLSFAAARQAAEARTETRPDLDSVIARWREAMARERRAAWPGYGELVPLRVPARRQPL
jgi:hypothetical protein